MFLTMRFLLLLWFFKYNLAIEADIGGKTAKFDKFFEPCPKEEGALGNYTISNMKTVGSNIIFDFNINYGGIFQQGDGDLELWFERCLSKEALDTCKILQKLKSKNGCFLLAAKNQVWSPVVSCLEPKLQCPIQKGFYSGTGCSLDFSYFNYVPLGRYYWKIKTRHYSPKIKKTLFCGDFAGQIIRKS